ncbi:MAG: 4Fe-4S cluster-binding domain-containing protein [Methanobrevibacter sp.]|nr:4Fe-4S cluster-binding domain-containing protein [Methanobrevibacter sp.]
MKLKGLIEEDFLQYKEPSMFLIFPFCTFKCDKENGTQVCQNWSLNDAPIIETTPERVVKKYLSNDITRAIVCGGLEPFESFDDLYELIKEARKYTDDLIIIYTGFRNDEIDGEVEKLREFNNIIIKFGRYIPGQEGHVDPWLGVTLSSLNQYAVKIS